EKVQIQPSPGLATRQVLTVVTDEKEERATPVGRQRSVTEGAEPWSQVHIRNGTAKPKGVTERSTFLNAWKLLDGATVRVFHSEIQVSIPKKFKGRRKMPKREKNDITNFSKKSRFRMIRIFNRIQTKRLSAAIFISCTDRHDT